VTARLREKYLAEVVPELKTRLGRSNVMELPKLEKIVVSIGLGEAIQNAKALESAERDLATVCGQHPVVTRAKSRCLQAENWNAYWDDGDTTRQADVRFL